MKLFLYHEIFAANASGGNSCWVVAHADPLSDKQMRETARVLSVSATGFICDTNKHSARIRFFSPTGEFDMCGHALPAASCALAELEIIPSTIEPQQYHLKSPTGEVLIETRFISPMLRHCAMTQQRPWFKPTTTDAKVVAPLLGIPSEAVNPDLPIETGSTGLKHLFVPLIDAQAMQSMQPNFDGLKQLSNTLGVESIAVFTQDTGDSKFNVRIRDLCPAIGTDEEAASGTTNGAVSSYLVRHGRAIPDVHDNVIITAQQGIEMGRPSTIRTDIHVEGGSIVSVKVGGTARQLATGELNL